MWICVHAYICVCVHMCVYAVLVARCVIFILNTQLMICVNVCFEHLHVYTCPHSCILQWLPSAVVFVYILFIRAWRWTVLTPFLSTVFCFFVLYVPPLIFLPFDVFNSLDHFLGDCAVVHRLFDRCESIDNRWINPNFDCYLFHIIVHNSNAIRFMYYSLGPEIFLE